MEEELKMVYKHPNLVNGQIVIGTNSQKTISGLGNLCVVVHLEDGCEVIQGASGEFIEKEKYVPSVEMYEKFEYTEEKVSEHPQFNMMREYATSFFEFALGSRLPVADDGKFGEAFYVGRIGDNVQVIYPAFNKHGEKFESAKNQIYMGRVIPAQTVIGMVDAGKRKFRVRYITVEDNEITVTVASLDRITDMKELLYQLGG